MSSSTRYERGKRYGGFALERLFEDCSVLMDERGTGFRESHSLPLSWPTFPDSEVQVMNSIHPDYLLGAWIETPKYRDRVQEALDAVGRDDCDVVVHPFEPRIRGEQYSWG